MRKTKRTVSIPFGKATEDLLLKLKENNNSPYVLPQQAEMFLKDNSQVSYRIKKFLDELGIKTTVATDGQKRQISIKDFHSCRHSFCYFAGINNIPLSIVQNIVGHMSPSMTAHYMAHVRNEDKKASLAKMPQFLTGPTIVTETPPKKEFTPFERAIIGLSGIKLLKALVKIESHLSEEAKNEVISYCKTLG